MPATAQSDTELLLAVRLGDQAAVAELFARHHAAARRLATTTSGPTDPDDLVNEAFEKVFGAIRRDTGPTEAFRAYLFVTIRRLAARHAAQQQDDPYDEVPEPLSAVEGNPLDADERAMVTQAFTALPERWQAVLWHTAVEGRNPREVADVLGMSANAVSALAYRAREKLRQSYLQAHLQAAPRPDCEPHRSSLGSYVRQGLGRREQAATAKHVETCPACQALIRELDDVNQLLARAILPLFLVETVGEAVGAPIAAAAGSADILNLAAGPTPSAGPPEVLNAVDAVDIASAPARRLGGILPEGASTGQIVGAGVATLTLMIALGAGTPLVLDGDGGPGPEVVTDDGDDATTETPDGDTSGEGNGSEGAGRGSPDTGSVVADFNDMSAAEIANALGCTEAPGDGDGGVGAEVDASAEVGSGPGDGTDAGSGSLLDVEIDVGITLGEALSIDDEDDLPPEIQDVTCDDSSGANELLVTIASETTSTTTTATTETEGPDPIIDVEADVQAGVATSVLPEVEVGAQAGVDEDLGIEVGLSTNLDELCDPDGHGNLVCRIDDELLGGVLGNTLGILGDAGVEIEIGANGDRAATVDVGGGDAHLDVNPSGLLPGGDENGDGEQDEEQDEHPE